jgi:hypothetical protein
MSGWRTSCGVVYNETLNDFSVENPVTPAGSEVTNKLAIPAGQSKTFSCTELFWECENKPQIDANALRFRWGSVDVSQGIPEFYMFMEKGTTGIVWCPHPSSYEDRRSLNVSRRGCLDVRIRRGPNVGTIPTFFPVVNVIW